VETEPQEQQTPEALEVVLVLAAVVLAVQVVLALL
jgi:hypothetical protein